MTNFCSNTTPGFTLNQDNLQQCLKELIESTPESWTYAIFWQSSVLDEGSGSTVLGWGDGYYKGGDDEDKGIRRTSSYYSPGFKAEQQHRKKVLNELNSLISGHNVPEDGALDEEVTDTEWFFLVSMTQSFEKVSGLPGQAFSGSSPIWIARGDKSVYWNCDRARQARTFGLQTMVFIPSEYGVVEFGSTALIYQSDDLINKVRAFSNKVRSVQRDINSTTTSVIENDINITDLYDSDNEASVVTDVE